MEHATKKLIVTRESDQRLLKMFDKAAKKLPKSKRYLAPQVVVK